MTERQQQDFARSKRRIGFVVRYKHDILWFWTALNWILRLWGRLVHNSKREDYVLSSITTIGKTIWVPDTWDAYTLPEKYAILFHEISHLDWALFRDPTLQKKKTEEPPIGVLSQWLNYLVFSCRYLTSFSYRKKVELEAYKQQAVRLVESGFPLEIVLIKMKAILESDLYGSPLIQSEADWTKWKQRVILEIES